MSEGLKLSLTPISGRPGVFKSRLKAFPDLFLQDVFKAGLMAIRVGAVDVLERGLKAFPSNDSRLGGCIYLSYNIGVGCLLHEHPMAVAFYAIIAGLVYQLLGLQANRLGGLFEGE